MKMTKEMAEEYCTHIKRLAHIDTRTRVFYMKLNSLKTYIQNLSNNELIVHHSDLRDVFDSCLSLMERKEFSRKARLFSNIQYLVFADLVRMYNIVSIFAKEVLARFKTATIDEMGSFKKIFDFYEEIMMKLKSSAKVWPLTFNFEFKEPKYFTPATGTAAKLDRI